MLARRHRVLLCACLAGMTVLASGVLADDEEVRVFLNDEPLALAAAPVVVDGHTLVPVRPVCEALGASVTWFQAAATVSVGWPGGSLSLSIGAATGTLNGAAVALPVPARIIAGHVYVPVRVFSMLPGRRVGWYRHGRIVAINALAKPLLEATVVRVALGDTVEVLFADTHTERVRLIGIGDWDIAFVESRLKDKMVLLETDDERDEDGRLLAYVYEPDGTMFNAMLLDGGYAKVAGGPPNARYTKVFGTLETKAKEAKRGRWAREEEGKPGSGQGRAHQEEAGPANGQGEGSGSASEEGRSRDSEDHGRGQGKHGNGGGHGHGKP